MHMYTSKLVRKNRFTHHSDDRKNNLEGRLIDQAVKRVGADELFEVGLSLETPDVPPPCRGCVVLCRVAWISRALPAWLWVPHTKAKTIEANKRAQM